MDKKFSDGARSQEAIRDVAKTLKELPEEDRIVYDFFQKEKTFSDLPTPIARSKSKPSLSDACQALIGVLLDLDSTALTLRDRRILDRTDAVLHQVVGVRA